MSVFVMSSPPRQRRSCDKRQFCGNQHNRHGLAREVLKKSTERLVTHSELLEAESITPAVHPMNLNPAPDFPPPDFVAFLAQRGGLSEEAAEHRLEDWLDEYFVSSRQRSNGDRSARSDRAL